MCSGSTPPTDAVSELLRAAIAGAGPVNHPLSKYAPLGEYLEGSRLHGMTLIFKEIERIIGSELPASARSHPSFWANDLQHSQARAWIGAGWASSGVSTARQTVTFTQGSKASAKSQKLTDHEFLTFVLGSRRAAQAKSREIGAAPDESPTRRDQRVLVAMVQALPENAILDAEIHPPPSRGHRTKQGIGWVTVRSRENPSVPICATFGSGRMEVDVTLPCGLGDSPSWPSDRAPQAWTFLPLWESQDPWLVVRTDYAAGPAAPLYLHASLSFRDVPSPRIVAGSGRGSHTKLMRSRTVCARSWSARPRSRHCVRSN